MATAEEGLTAKAVGKIIRSGANIFGELTVVLLDAKAFLMQEASTGAS